MNSKPIHILIADDEPDVLEFLSYNLAKKGFEVARSNDGWEAVALANKIKPDLIVMDVHMPGLSGIEACRMIKANHELKDIPVLFLTGDSDEYVSMIATRAGGNHYINKPIHVTLLMNMIRELLQSRFELSN